MHESSDYSFSSRIGQLAPKKLGVSEHVREIVGMCRIGLVKISREELSQEGLFTLVKSLNSCQSFAPWFSVSCKRRYVWNFPDPNCQMRCSVVCFASVRFRSDSGILAL